MKNIRILLHVEWHTKWTSSFECPQSSKFLRYEANATVKRKNENINSTSRNCETFQSSLDWCQKWYLDGPDSTNPSITEKCSMVHFMNHWSFEQTSTNFERYKAKLKLLVTNRLPSFIRPLLITYNKQCIAARNFNFGFRLTCRIDPRLLAFGQSEKLGSR